MKQLQYIYRSLKLTQYMHFCYQPCRFGKHFLLILSLMFSVISAHATFTSLTTDLPVLRDGWFAFADYDNDGDLDAFSTGQYVQNQTGVNQCKLYRNMGNWVFTDSGNRFGSFNYGQAAWGDFNNDGWLDIAVSGRQNSAAYADSMVVFINNQGQSFTPLGQNFYGTYKSSHAWVDIDNDFDLDLITVGMNGNSGGYADTGIYYNDGQGNLSYDPAYALSNIGGFYLAYLDVQDFDKDGWLDIGISGTIWGGTGSPYCVAYRQTSPGVYASIFSEATGGGGGLSWFDYDSDGDLDFLLSGMAYPTGMDFTTLYSDNGSRLFYPVDSNLPPTSNGDLATADYDNDGDDDVFLTSWYSSINNSAWLYNNDGAGNFTESPWEFDGLGMNNAQWVDLDNDKDLDLVNNGGRIYYSSFFYRNDTPNPNTPPSPPQLSYSAQTGFTLSGATDAQTPAQCLTYDLRIGTSPGGAEVLHPAADLLSGYRRISGPGRSSFAGYRLPEGTFYASAQAIDGAFVGSAWSDEVIIHNGVENSDLVNSPNPLTLQISPNPFSQNVKLSFSVTEASSTKLEVFNLKGQKLATLCSSNFSKGQHSMNWNAVDDHGTPLSAGIYLLKLTNGTKSIVSRFAVLR